MKKSKVVIAILAKMGSKRLPEKLVRMIEGKTAIEHLIEGALKSREADEVALAAADVPENEVLAKIASKWGVGCFKGSEVDTLDRLYRTGEEFGADAVLRLTGDNIVVDPDIVDRLIRAYRSRERKVAFATTCLPPTFPEGFSMEIVSQATLRELHGKLAGLDDRATFMIYLANHPEEFPRYNLAYKRDVSHLRLTMDYAEDLEVITKVFAHRREQGRDVFVTDEVVAFLEAHPEIAALNASRQDRTKYPFGFGRDAIVKAM